MKKLKILLQHNIIYYVFLFIVFVLYITNSSINHESVYKEFNNETMTITDIIEKDYGLKLFLKGKEKAIGYLYLDKKEIKKYKKKYLIGDKIKLTGNIQDIKENTVPNTFNYKKYLISNEIYNVINIIKIKKISSTNNIFYKIKKYLIKRGEKLPKSQSYINSLIFGNNSYLDESILSSYRENGISHLFAISGLHISIFIAIIAFILDKIKIKSFIKYFIIILFLIFYMFLTNFSMSVIRGSIFTILIFINKIFKLDISTKNLLLAALILIMFYNPLYINNVGLLYSFLVTFSLIIFSNLIKGSKIKQLFMISLISFLVSYPITINNFYGVNFLSIIYNIFFIPYTSMVLLPLVLISYIFPFLDNILYISIKVIEDSSLFLSNINIGKVNMSYMGYILIFIYYVIIFITLKRLSNKKYKMFLVLIVFFIIHYFIPIKNDNYIIIFDVNQGDSTLIKLNNTYTLIDTGGKITYQDEKYDYKISNNKLIPYFKANGIRKIDNLVLTHGDADHMREAKNIVKNIKVEKVIFNTGEYNYLEQDLIKELIKEKIKYYKDINKLNIRESKLYFLNTRDYDNENDNSIVTYLNLNNYKFLFMGDAGIEREQDILNQYNLKNVDFIKIGHHGSNTSSSKEFIDSINPKNCLISVGENNRYGHPKESVLDILDDYCDIYRTDLNGSIEIKINNNGYKIRNVN